MIINKKILVAVTAASCLLLTACSSDETTAPVGGVTYTGSTAPAVITSANADSLAGSATKGSSGGQAVAIGAIGGASAINVLSLANAVINVGAQDVHSTVGVASGAIQTVNQTINGADFGGSGTITVTGNADDITGYGTYTYTINQFDDGAGTVVNGVEEVVIDASGFGVTFTKLTVTDATGTFTIGGKVKITEVLDGAGNLVSDTLTMDFVASNSNGQQVKLQNFVVTTTYDTTNAVTSESFAGRFYDSVDGYLDITTTSPMVYSPAGATNPSSGGPIIATGANNTKVRITPVDATNVLVEADTTGDGNYDYSVQKAWSAL